MHNTGESLVVSALGAMGVLTERCDERSRRWALARIALVCGEIDEGQADAIRAGDTNEELDHLLSLLRPARLRRSTEEGCGGWALWEEVHGETEAGCQRAWMVDDGPGLAEWVARALEDRLQDARDRKGGIVAPSA